MIGLNNRKVCPIPDYWNGADAFAAVAYLGRVIDAIWDAHGREMGLHLENYYAEREERAAQEARTEAATPPNQRPRSYEDDSTF